MFKGLFAQTVVWKPTGRLSPYHPSYEGPVSRRGRETFLKSSLLNPPGLLSFDWARDPSDELGLRPKV